MFGEKRILGHCWSECKLVQSFQKTMQVPQRGKEENEGQSELLDDPQIPSTTGMQLHIFNLKFFPALFTKVRLWKQLKCPSVDEWRKSPAHTHHRKNTIWFLKGRKF